jgi:hypothetical protein
MRRDWFVCRLLRRRLLKAVYVIQYGAEAVLDEGTCPLYIFTSRQAITPNIEL